MTDADGVDTNGEPIGGDAVEAPVRATPPPHKTISCKYSPVNLGVSMGEQIPPAFEWQGHAANEPIGEPVLVHSTDHYDCEGSKGVHAIVFETGSHT